MNKGIFFVFILCFLQLLGCRRYYSINMLGEDNINVTNLIKKGYKPIYCPDKKIICKLINPHPDTISEMDLNEIEHYLKFHNCNAPQSLFRDSIKYTTTYFISYFPVDCYNLNFKYLEYEYYLEIRKEFDNTSDGHLILPNEEPGDRFNVKHTDR